MEPLDLTLLTSEDLDALRVDVIIEQERRTSLAAIPAQINALALAYVAAGGEQSVVDAAVEPVVVEEPVVAPA